jgi:hypothetical protein
VQLSSHKSEAARKIENVCSQMESQSVHSVQLRTALIACVSPDVAGREIFADKVRGQPGIRSRVMQYSRQQLQVTDGPPRKQKRPA